MYNVVTVWGIVSHVIHSTKSRAPTVISTCNWVNKNFSLKQSSFLVMYLTLTYYISLNGVAEGYNFMESREVMLQATGQDSTTCVTRRLNHLFFLIYSNVNYIVFKITNTSYLFSFIGCLTEGLSHLCQNMHTRIPKYGVFMTLESVFQWQYDNKLTELCSNLDFVKAYQIHCIILTKSIILTRKDIMT